MPSHELDAILLQIRTVALELRRLEGDGLDGLGLCPLRRRARRPEVAAGRNGQPRPGNRRGLTAAAQRGLSAQSSSAWRSIRSSRS